MLVHVCCSVDSHYFLTRLKADYPNERIIGYFYNPNIHPKEEYDLRLIDAKRSCVKLDIELIDDEYNDKDWFSAVKNLEQEPEKGKRCEVCFDMRFIKSAKIAKTFGLKKFTSTLLQSPLKNQTSLSNSALFAAKEFGVEFIFVDYRSKGGMNEQNEVAKKEGLYRQNYCGCVYGLFMQRAKQNKTAFELISDVNAKLLPATAVSRQVTFAKNGSNANAQILNYKILRAFIKSNNETIPSAVLAYSKPVKESWNEEAFYQTKNILSFKSAKIITLELYNLLANTHFKALEELQNASFITDILVKSKLSGIDAIDFLPVFVVCALPNNCKIEFYLNSEVYEDKEFLATALIDLL